MKLKVGVQLYSLRDDMEKDFEGTLKRVKELGYDGVEFAGLFNRKGAEVRELLEKLSLEPISAHVALSELLENAREVLGEYKALGVKYIAIPYLPNEDRPEAGHFEETLEKIKKICKEAESYDITMLYHNHDFEFNMYNGEYYLETIYNSISPEILQSELDTCWVNVGGEDPAQYLRKFGDRAPVVHLKDFVMNGKAEKSNLYELIGIDKSVEENEDSFAFRPVGYGAQDFESILQACHDVGTQWVIVELDRPAPGLSPFECVKLSVEYLEKINK